MVPRGVLSCAAVASAMLGCSSLLDLDVHYVEAGAETGPPSLDAGDDGTGLEQDSSTGSPDATTVDSEASAPPDGVAPVEASQTAIDAASDAPHIVVPITYVQGTAGQATNGINTVVVQLPNSVNVHDTIVVTADASSGGDLDIKDSLGNAFTFAYGVQDGSGIESGLFYAIDVPTAGPDTLTFTLLDDASTINFLEVYVHEYSGVSGYDGAIGQSGTTVAMTSGPFTTKAPGELVLGFGVTGSASPTANFTPRLTFNSNLTEDLIQSVPGSVEATATMTSGNAWQMLLGAFTPR